MRFVCDTNELNTALSIVSRALAVRSTKPILEGILFESCDEGLRLTCTDLALGIETTLPATFSEEGRAVLPGKLLCEIIRKLPGGACDITIGERMQATIRCASIRTTINGFDPVEYPELPQVEGESFALPQNTLKDMIGRTLFAIAQDESRPILTGCLMEINRTEMRVVALDGFRLALRKENIQGPNAEINAVVGGRVLGDIAKILADTEEEASLCFTKTHVRLNIGQTRIGVAISDPRERVASPVCVLPANEVLSNAKSWKRVLEDWEPELILSGLPYTLSGEEGPQAGRIRGVAASIGKAAGLPVEFTDERLSSQEAKRSLRESGMSERDMRGKIDMIAASVFLQAWLDARHAGER